MHNWRRYAVLAVLTLAGVVPMLLWLPENAGVVLAALWGSAMAAVYWEWVRKD